MFPRAWSAIAKAAADAHITVVLGTERIVEGVLIPTALVFNQDGSRAGFQDKVQMEHTWCFTRNSTKRNPILVVQ